MLGLLYQALPYQVFCTKSYHTRSSVASLTIPGLLSRPSCTIACHTRSFVQACYIKPHIVDIILPVHVRSCFTRPSIPDLYHQHQVHNRPITPGITIQGFLYQAICIRCQAYHTRLYHMRSTISCMITRGLAGLLYQGYYTSAKYQGH